MDEDISRWVTEFILRKCIGDSLVSRLMCVLPVSSENPRLKKTVLLKKIQSEISDGSVSEKILELLEVIEELDHREGIAVSESMKDAYCAVAVECTVKFLVGSGNKDGKYFDAVKRIWRRKVNVMENSENKGLSSNQMRKWRDEIEAALCDARVCEELLGRNTRNDALKKVRVYLAETWAILGPPFLDVAARTKKALEELTEAANASTCNQASASSPNVAKDSVAPTKDKGSSPNVAKDPVVPSKAKEIQNASVVPRRKHVFHGRRSRGGVKITDTEETSEKSPANKYDCLPTPEVDKVQEALKTSSLELQAVVKDPLPDALQFAETVLSEMARKDASHEPLTKDPVVTDVEAPNPSVENNVEMAQTNDADLGNKCNAEQKNVPKPSLMMRNSTAHTYEWDDSIEATSEDSPNRSNIHLPSPKRNAVSPLSKYEFAKFTKRRKMKKWSILEEDTLRTGIQKFGKGNWTLILNSYRDIFEGRTPVDLKDKWRNMTR